MPRKANSNMPSGTPDTLDHDAVVRELAALMDMLRDHAASQCSPDDVDTGPFLAVARLVPGVSPETWRSLAEEHDLADWLALPVGGERWLHPDRMQALLSALQEALGQGEHHGPLAGFVPRPAFMQRMDLEFQRLQREEGRLSLALFRVDEHAAWAQDDPGRVRGALEGLARIVSEAQRPFDLAARLDDATFALVMPGCGAHNIRVKFDRLRAALRTLCLSDNGQGKGAKDESAMTVHAGLVSCKGRPCIDARAFVALAEKALDEARDKGTDTVVQAPTQDTTCAPKITMVKSDEKKFLFTGP